jgi:hypothetical protein
MKLHKILQKIPKKQKTLIRKFVYQAIYIFRFKHHPKEGLNSLKRKLNLYFLFNPKQKQKFSEEITFLNKRAVTDFSYSFIFPYDFVFNYDYHPIKVYTDTIKGLFYVLHNGRKLYYSKEFRNEFDVQIQYYCISIEQDKHSPHRYFDKKNNMVIYPNDVVIDIGAAEGNFALDSIEEINHLYIFEVNKEWCEALEATYEPWKEKVTIYNKYVSDTNNEENVTLDFIMQEKIINCVKIDVEGAELSILEHAELTLNNSNINLFICTYHKQEDASKFENLLKNKGFTCSFTQRFMLFTLRELNPPYFRKGLIRASK